MMNELSILANVALAMLFGGLIGLEREIADKPAGLRTHMLVAGTAALLVRLGDALIAWFPTANNTTVPAADPMRIVQAIVMGIGFLGAGTIIQRANTDRIEGLTTGATLLFVATVGICTATGLLILAGSVTMTALVLLVLLGGIEKWFTRSRRAKSD